VRILVAVALMVSVCRLKWKHERYKNDDADNQPFTSEIVYRGK